MKKQINTFYDFKGILLTDDNLKNYEEDGDDKVIYASYNFNAICLFDKYMKGQLSAAAYSIFNFFVSECNFAGDNEWGGQTVKFTAQVKELFLKTYEMKLSTFDKALRELKEEELIIKRAPNIYQVNPLLYSKGNKRTILFLQIYVLETGVIKNISSEAVLTKAQKVARQNYVNKEKERRANIVKFESRNEDKEQYIDDSKEYTICAEKRESYIKRNFM